MMSVPIADVNGHRHVQPRGGAEDRQPAEVRMRAGEVGAHGLTQPLPLPMAFSDRAIEHAPGFLGHAELPLAEHRVHFFRRRAGQRDFEVMNEAGAVHRDRGDEPALHQIDQHRPKAGLDDVRAESPHDAAVFCLGAADGRHDGAKIRGSEQVGQGLEEAVNAGGRIPRTGELFVTDFARALGQRIRPHAGEIELVVAERHGAHSISMASP